jgi:hypothetical protein
MQGKFLYGGEGAKVPSTDFGMSFGIFKLWLCPDGGEWRGYTAASNEGLLGLAIVESPVVTFQPPDAVDQSVVQNLHGSTVDATLDSNMFAIDGGIATLTLDVKSNMGSATTFSFFSDECKGGAVALGEIHFRVTLLELPNDEWDPHGWSYVPW